MFTLSLGFISGSLVCYFLSNPQILPRNYYAIQNGGFICLSLATEAELETYQKSRTATNLQLLPLKAKARTEPPRARDVFSRGASLPYQTAREKRAGLLDGGKDANTNSGRGSVARGKSVM